MSSKNRFIGKWNYIGVAVLMLLAAGCATLHVTTDYNHRTDFAAYHTYSWLRVHASNSLWADRIRRDVNAQLSARGWREVPSGGEAAVSAFGSTRDMQSLQTFYSGFGPGFGGWGWGGWWGGGFGTGVATTQTVNTPVGSLVVDIFSSRDKRLIWRGEDSEVLAGNPQTNRQRLEKAVTRMFRNFPPVTAG